MKGREGKGPPSTDLLVCFPSRAHLTLMPKPICSPARHSESSKRQHNHQHNNANHHNHHHHHHHHYHHHLKKSSYRSGAVSQASPLLWAKTKPISKDISEPTSPKVTCAGQIKVRSKPASSCKNWQSVMEEIERLHNNRKHKKKSTWVEALGFKKDVMQFLTCLRNIRFDFRCFGSLPTSVITSDDDEDDEEDDEDYQEPRISRGASDDSETSRTVFSKWFMVLQENNNKDLSKKEIDKKKEKSKNEESIEEPCAPPPNALLLMRCRSAPAKSWLQERQEVEEEEEEEEESNNDEDEKQQKEEDEKNAKQAMEEEKRRKENLVVMRYGTDFYKFSSDIANETWVVGGIRDSLARSRSWKR